MANFFTLRNGNLFDNNVSYRSVASQDYAQGSTREMLLSSALLSIPYFNLTETVTALAVNLFSRSENPVGTVSFIFQNTSFSDTLYYSPNHTINVVGNIYSNTFSPFRPDGWSALFDTTAHVIAPRIDFSNRAFTIEGWFNPLVPVGPGTNFFGQNNGAGSFPKITFYSPVGTGQLACTFSGTTFATISTALTVPASSIIPVNQWTHLAVVREGTGVNQCKIYANGFVVASGTYAGSLSGITQSFNIGHVGEAYGNKFNGYISNFRILSGRALYTNNFTPSTTALTNIENTALLALQSNSISKDNSDYDNYLTTNGSPRIRAISPFIPAVPYSKELHGGSASLRGGGTTILNTLSTPTFSASNFTVEGWIYLRSNSSLNNTIITVSNGIATNSNYSWYFAINNALNLFFGTYNGNTGYLATSTRTLTLNSWYHVAAVRNGTTNSIYINGVLAGTNNAGNAIINYSNNMTYSIGDTGGRAAYSFDGYISNLRVVSGDVLYTANFTPSASPLTNIPNTDLLLNTDNLYSSGLSSSFTETYPVSGFTSYDCDISKNVNIYAPSNWQILKLSQPLSANLNYIISLSTSNSNELSLVGDDLIVDEFLLNKPSFTGNVTVSLSAPPNHLRSIYINQGSWIVYPANASFNFDADFTWELWFNNTVFTVDNSVGRRIIGFGANAANNLQLILGTATANTNVVSLYGNAAAIINGTIPVSDGLWHHIAVSRVGNILKLFVDGVQSGPTYTTFTVYDAGVTNPLSIGTYNNSSASGRLSGAYISDLRMIKGVGLYTSNFVVPSGGPLKAVDNAENVVLLKCDRVNFNKYLITNDSNNNVTIPMSLTKTGTTLSASSAISPYAAGVDSSIQFNNADILTLNNTKTPFYGGVGDFTFETWLNTRDNSFTIFSVGGGTNRLSIGFNIDNNSQGLGAWRTGVGNIGTTGIADTRVRSITSGAWKHVAVTRKNTIFNYFIDGALISSVSSSYSFIPSTISYVGRDGSTAGFYYTGLISNLRFIDGEALYTSSFTPVLSPLSAYYNIKAGSYTSILYQSPYSNTYLRSDIDHDLHIGGVLNGLDTEYRTITADTGFLNDLYIHNGGTLIFPLTSSKTLNVVGYDGIRINSDATLNIGSSSRKIPSNTTHTIVGDINVINGGNFNVYGSDKLPYAYLLQDAASSSRTFTANNSVSTNWLSGDSILFTPNRFSKTSYDILTLSTFNSNNIFTTTTGSRHSHDSLSSLRHVPSISNLSRNVILTSRYEGSITTQEAAKVNIHNALISNSNNYYSNNSAGYTSLTGNAFVNTNNCVLNKDYFYRDYSASIDSGRANSRIDLTDASLVIGTGPFTLEFWFKPKTFVNSAISLIGNWAWSMGNNFGWHITYYNSGYFNFLYSYGSWNRSTEFNTNSFASMFPTSNSWMHVAFVRDSNNLFSCYVNGISIGLTRDPIIPDSFNQTGGSGFSLSKIGQYYGDGYQAIGSFDINSVRLNVGQALYTSNFRPPSRFVTNSSQGSIPSNVKLLLNITTPNGPFVDQSPLSGAVTRGGGVLVVQDTNINTKVNNNINIQNNVFFRNTINGLEIAYLSAFNINISDNLFIDTFNFGFVTYNLYNPLTIPNNYIVGSRSHGTYLRNVSGINATLINYSGLSSGVYVEGRNTGTIKLTSTHNNDDGLYLSAAGDSSSGLVFSDIFIDNNLSNGFEVVGNNTLFNPVRLTINGLRTNNNGRSGFDALCMIGNITGLEASGNNLSYNMNNIYNARISIGNGVTKINGLTSISNNWRQSIFVATSASIANASTSTVTLSTCSPANDGSRSLYFDGTATSFLGISFHPIYNLSPNIPFTFEAWIYNFGNLGSANVIFAQRQNHTATSGNWIGLEVTNGNIYFWNGTNYTTGRSLLVNRWQHFAVVYDGSNLTFYLNGINVSRHTNVSIANINEPFTLGGERTSTPTTGVNMFRGYMNNVRFVRGYTVYTKNFVPSTAPLATIPGTLCLFQYPAGSTRVNTYTSLSTHDKDFYGLGILSGISFSDFSISNAHIKTYYPLYLDSTRFEQFNLESSLLSAGGLQDIIFDNTYNLLEGSYAFHNNKFDSQHIIDQIDKYQPDGYQETGMSFMRHQSLSGNHFKVVRSGKISIDKTFGYTAAKVSEKLEPYSYSNTIPLRSSVKRIPINYGEFTSISVYIYKSITPNYSGTPPRLVLRQNASIGYSYTVLATSIEPNGIWEKLYATLPFATNDGVMEVYIECSADSGYVSIDYWNF